MGCQHIKVGLQEMLSELAFRGRQQHVTANMNDQLEGCWVSSIVAMTAHMLAHFHPHILSACPTRPATHRDCSDPPLITHQTPAIGMNGPKRPSLHIHLKLGQCIGGWVDAPQTAKPSPPYQPAPAP